MSNTADDLRVFANGHVWIAEYGTATIPAKNTNPTATPAGFLDLGYITEDGVTATSTPTITEFRAWQARQAVRRERSAQDLEFKFSMEEWRAGTVQFAFGGGTVEASGGYQTYTFPDAGDALDEISMVVDTQDGDFNYRYVISRGNVTDAVEVQFKAEALAVLPVTFKGLDDGVTPYIITDDPSWDSGS